MDFEKSTADIKKEEELLFRSLSFNVSKKKFCF